MENKYLKKTNNKNSQNIINVVLLVLLGLFLFFNIERLGNFFNSTVSLWNTYSSYFITGLGVTLLLSIISVLIGTVLGILIYSMRSSRSKVPRAIAKTIVEVVRGTPLLVQLFIAFFGASILIDFRSSGIPTAIFAFMAGIVAVSINSGAYVSEIIRSGIQSISKGQMEAGRSLGMSRKMTMREIIMPQAVKNILPALANEFITIIKETSIVSIIGVTDIMYNVNIVRGNSFKSMEPLIIAAIIYFIFTFTLSRLVGLFERRLKESD